VNSDYTRVHAWVGASDAHTLLVNACVHVRVYAYVSMCVCMRLGAWDERAGESTAEPNTHDSG
jgi:hypothetical protein